MECADVELSILITDDDEIRLLNSKYRNKNKATDVLSFRLSEGEAEKFAGAALGDLVISVDTAKKQAAGFKQTLKQELLRLLIHGTLHLLGYEHENVSSKIASKMRKEEKRLYKLIE